MRARAAVVVVLAVLLLHSALLALLDPAPGRAGHKQPVRAVSVRQLPAPAASPAAPPVRMPDVPRENTVARAPPEASPAPTQTPEVSAAAPAPAETQGEPAPPAETGGLQVPVYATQLPPAAVLRYESRRGLAQGVAELSWRRSADGFQLSLQGQALGAPLIGWASSGGFDEAGIAPVRYTELRRGREVRAANFQRDNGRVTFSGPAVEHPLVPGMQDRLSWLLQLPGVLQANPALAQAGAQVQLAVVGTRGDAEVWVFTVQGRGPLELPAGPVADAVHLLREPRRPYDTQVQVWLDPARGHLPVQAFLRIRATGEGTELRLVELRAP